MRHVLIVKCAALGDVVRTSHFAAALRHRHGDGLRISWLTAPEAAPLLAGNPDIHDLWFDAAAATGATFDRIFSLEEDAALVAAVARLRASRITGLVPTGDGGMTYTPDAAGWFDMSLVSRLGRADADRRKRDNRRSHAEIFSGIFDVPGVRFGFHGDPLREREAEAWRGAAGQLIGVSPHAGARWPSKALPPEVRAELVGVLRAGARHRGDTRIVLLGAGAERAANLALARSGDDGLVLVPDTDGDVMRLAAIVRQLDYLIASDSLALHLALAQSVPFLAFFAPTSAAEIDDGGIGAKLTSTAPDYPSYRPDADNRSITAARILALAAAHRPAMFGGLV